MSALTIQITLGSVSAVQNMKLTIQTLASFLLSSHTIAATAPEMFSDHFAPDEDVDDSFAWEPGAQCVFSDGTGVVLHSNWMQRHWIKNSGEQVEFNGDVQMSDEGWFQTFVNPDFTVTLRLRRAGGEPEGSDGVGMVGEIVVIRSEQSSAYQVTGGCGA